MTEFKNSSFRGSITAVACGLLTSTAGATWESPLRPLVNVLSNSAVQALLLMSTVALGLALIFSKGSILRRVLSVLLGAALVLTATSFLLGFFGLPTGWTF